MNMKELEAFVKALQARVEEQGKVINEQGEIIVRCTTFLESWPVVQKSIENLGLKTSEAHTALQEQSQFLEGHTSDIGNLREDITQLQIMVGARNASAPTKRNMTDDDAIAVLTGDFKGLGHKEAAEKIGLTYAHVYSCRLEYTFKHVHKRLRDHGVNNQPWKNPWAR